MYNAVLTLVEALAALSWPRLAKRDGVAIKSLSITDDLQLKRWTLRLGWVKLGQVDAISVVATLVCPRERMLRYKRRRLEPRTDYEATLRLETGSSKLCSTSKPLLC